MHILHLSSENGWRGGEQQIAYLLEETRQLQPNWALSVACKPESQFFPWCRQHNFTTLPLPLKNNLDLKSARRIRQYCRANGVDLIHVHSSRGQSIAWLSYLLGNHVPVLLTRRVAFRVKQKLFNRLKYNFPTLRGIACISAAAQEATQAVLTSPRPLRVIYDGIRIEKFTSSSPDCTLRSVLKVEAGTPLVGIVAALSHEKDVASFIKSAEVLRRSWPEARFVIIGDGPQRSELEALSQQLGLNHQLHFLGFRQDVPELLPQLDVFMLTSQQEGLGTSVLDAFASRVPVVATAAGGLPELIREGETGFLAPVGDYRKLAERAGQLLSQPHLRQQLQEQAFTELQERFTARKMAVDTLGFYQELLG